MWKITIFAILLGTILVQADRYTPEPGKVNILVARKWFTGTTITKLTKNRAVQDYQNYGWRQVDGANALSEGDMSYFTAYERSFEQYSLWDDDARVYKYYGGFTKRINVCRLGDSSLITDDACSNISRTLSNDFSFFVAEAQKRRTKKIYSTVCHDERNDIAYSTLSTRNHYCWIGSVDIARISFYVFVGKRFCMPLGSPPDGLGTIVNKTSEDRVRVTSITYRCSHGYNLLGSATINCGSDGRWRQRQPTCEAVRCGPPPLVNHGRLSNGGPFTYSMVITYYCDEGYNRYPSSAAIECLGNGRWSRRSIWCRPVDCGFPGSFDDGRIYGSHYTYGQDLTFKCNRGFALEGARTITCEANGIWSQELPKCERILCPPLNATLNGRQHLLNRRLDSEVVVQCNFGYKIDGYHTLKCVLKNGSKTEADWNHPAPVCSPITCTPPQTVENGRVFGNEYFFDSEVTYTCNTGYSLEGNDRLRCTLNNWDSAPPTCRALSCRDPGTPRNGRRTGDSMNFGSVMQFECDEGYTMLGQQSITCGEGPAWSAATPQCEESVEI